MTPSPLVLMLFACVRGQGDASPVTPPSDDSATTADTSSPGDAPRSTGTTGETAGTAETSDTAAPLPSLYPPVPYDCAAGVPAGPPAVVELDQVTTTEDFVFTLDGFLVASDFQGNLLQFEPSGMVGVLLPSATENRAFELLPDGAIAYTHGVESRIVRVDAKGAATTYATIPGVGGLVDLDVATDGTIATGNLSGWMYLIAADGTLTDFGRQSVQAYGVEFSVDESRIYWSSYSNLLFASDLQPDGSWSPPTQWVEIPGATTLSGIAVDACDNLYVVESFGCRLYRVSPAGDVELLLDLPTGPSSSCPNLSFGRALGGWDPLKLYVSTYRTLLEVDVGVPGRPR